MKVINYLILLYVFIVSIAGCAGYSDYSKAKSEFNDSNFVSAYSNIKGALLKSPNKIEYIEYKDKILDRLYADKWSDLKSLSDYDVENKLKLSSELLEFANDITDVNSKRANKKVAVESVNKYTAIQSELTTSINIVSSIKSVTELIVNKKHIENLSKYLKSNKKANECIIKLASDKTLVSNLLLRLSESNDSCDITEIYYKYIRPYASIEDNKSYDNIIAAYYDDLSVKYESNKLWISSKIIKKLPDIISNNKIDCNFIRPDSLEKLHIKIAGPVSAKLPEYIIESVKHRIGKAQVLEITEHKDNADFIIELLIIRNDKDIDVKPIKNKYSKYLEGYDSRSNPDYISAKNDYETARSGLYSAGGNAFLQGYYSTQANIAASRLSNTQPYIQVPVYRDYKYTEQEALLSSRLTIKINIIDTKLNYNKTNDTFSKEKSEKLVSIQNVHPDDSNYIKNTKQYDNEDYSEVLNKITSHDIDELSEIIDKEIRSAYVKRIKYYYGNKYLALAFEEYNKFIQLKNIDSDYNQYKNELQELTGTDVLQNISKLDLTNKTAKILGKITYIIENKTVKSDMNINNKTTTNDSVPKLVNASMNKVVLIKAHSKKGVSQGSGFFIGKNGIIATNYHVIKNSGDIRVYPAGSDKEFSASVEMTDSIADIAVIKIDIPDNDYFKTSKYEEVEVGESVIAIGAPHGYDKTVSKGIISGKRLMSLPNGMKTKQLQTDTMMTHGNSGGPLIDTNGKAVGINTWTENTAGTVGALNFAVAIDELLLRYSDF